MAEIIPFRGYRYAPALFVDLNGLISPPYDIITPEQRDSLYKCSPFNIVRVESGKELAGDNESENKYTRARAYILDWIRIGALIRDERESIYLHRMVYDFEGTEKEITGLICLVKLEEFSRGVVLPHEETLWGPKLDRFALMKACRANISSILGLFSAPGVDVFREGLKASKGEPVKAQEMNLRHELYVIQDRGFIEWAQELLRSAKLFIADGHHRYETALVLRDELRKEEGQGGKGPLPYDYVMMTLVNMDEGGLSILPTHRMVRGIEFPVLGRLVSKARDFFEVECVPRGESLPQLGYLFQEQRLMALKARMREEALRGRHAIGLYLGPTYPYMVLTLKDEKIMDDLLAGKASRAWRHLDVTILHTLILERILGIAPEEAAAGSRIAYTRDEMEAASWVDAGEFQAAFLLNPPKMEEIRDVALSGEKMPQKTTYFFPKLPTGLVIYRFEP